MSRSDGFVPWPAQFAARYRERGYWLGRPLGDHLWQWAERYSDRVALIDGDHRFSYRELAELADSVAVGLGSHGVGPGSTMLVQLPNAWGFVVLTLGCLRADVAPVMALPPHRNHELGHLAALAEVASVAVPASWRGFDHEAMAHEVASGVAGKPPLVIVDGAPTNPASLPLAELTSGPHGGRRAELDAIAPDAADIAVFLLSGGTTGLPKLIPRSHDDYEYNARRSGEVSGFGPDTVYLVCLPAGHNFPLACPGILGTLAVGGTVVMAPSPDPEVAFAAIERNRVTHVAVVPAVAQRWLDAVGNGEVSADLDSLRVLQVGGARLPPEVALRVTPTLGCALQQVFGMAEGLLNYTRLDDDAETIALTQGRPISDDDELAIVDDEDRPVPHGEPGSLLTRGPYTLRGYYRAAAHNEVAFTADGWYRTGDVVRRHGSGNLVVEGRTKDLVNRGGEKISAEEVEDLCYGHPGVSRVAAIAVPDQDLGERICVVLVPAPGATPTLEELRGVFADRQVARFKWPERVELVEELPLTNVGKIDKKALRERFAEIGKVGP